MDQSEQQQLLPPHQQVVPMTYTTSPYQTAPVVASGTPYPPQHQLVYQAQQFPQQQQHQQQQLQAFWAKQLQEVERAVDFKNHSLPLARIKKIMKADEDVRMISAEAPVVFAKACEMFILELTLRSWIHTEENKRRTLQKNDIAAAISRTDVFDFLVDIIPREELKEEAVGVTKGTVPAGESAPYYYVPQEHAALCASQQPRPPMAFIPQWPHAQSQLQQQPEQQQAEN